MKRKMIVCQTPFQVIVALFLNNQIRKNDECKVDAVITNTFNGYENLVKRLSDRQLFDKVICADAKECIQAKGKKGNISKLFKVLFPGKIASSLECDLFEYTEMFCWNYDAYTASIRSYLELKKHHIKVNVFDEGYISYMPIDDVIPKRGFMKIIELRNRLYGIGNITRENIDGMYLFEPELILYKPGCPIYKIDREIGKEHKFKEDIEYIFETKKVISNYDKKYIIFEEAMLANNPDIDDEKILDNFIDMVGKENVIVKLHPRTKEDRFAEKGIKTLGSDGIPWEAIVLAGGFEDKVFMTIGSGSVTNCRMLFGSSMNSYMLFKIVRPPMSQFDPKYDNFWEKLEDNSTDKSKGLKIPKTMKELTELLEIS